ncbi:pyridoxine/pyridoxamine 5'-phosphate oxidase 2-like isoform X2 [Primulina huaijiensis]|uniref:pyridoxine/pyridoxamine 5'-phosphate oxidase 2-like isoform X2 n=1 Tax=Primulina huaijiensis TaxID=1492673 RepID=UPI003CC7778C
MGSPSVAASWKQLLLNSIQSNSHLNHSSYLQIATVASNGRPSNRTVVFRGFQDDGHKIQINTDSRTRKIDDLKHCPFAEICWYFTNTWEQFRIGGQVDVIDGTNSDPVKLQFPFNLYAKQRERSWFACSLKSRMQYLAPAPRILFASEQQPTETPTLDSSMSPVGVFCLLVLNPGQVDYLNLKSNERLIFTAGQDGSGETHWSVEKVDP